MKPSFPWSLIALCLCACREDARVLTAVKIVAPPIAATVDGVAREDVVMLLTTTLTKMGYAPIVEHADHVTNDASLVIALDGDQLGLVTSAFGPGYDPTGAFDDRFALDTRREGDAQSVFGKGTLLVSITARSTLGRFYGAYELLRRLGARYFHPEDTWIPVVPAAQLFSRSETPTALGPGPVYTPDFTHRSWSFHGAHPLEHLESFSDARAPIDEAIHVNDWMIANRGDLFRGAGRGVASASDEDQRRAELEAFRDRRTLRYQAGITLHNQQQGASADIDPSSPEPVLEQIDRVVRERLTAAPGAYAFNIHFGPTELTTTPDLETLAWIDRAGVAAIALRPDIQVEINDHATGTQPVEHIDDGGCPPGTNDRGVSDYYDLAFHSDERLTARVHTVMFQPLEGPAGVYQQRSFAHKLCLMEKASAAGRPLGYFPEGAYWLSWDNAVPVYLPLYLWTRHRDIELLRPLLVKNGGTLRDHRLFNSGQEWGYWQQDYGVGLMQWTSDIALDDILGEMGDPLCDANHFRDCPARTTYIAVLNDVMARQADAFLTTPDFLGRPGGLYTYFAGEDPADEIGARSGLEFRPVRIAFRDVLALNDADAARFEATDLAALEELASFFREAGARLEAARSQVPPTGSAWLDEVIGGLTIDSERASHTLALYRAVLALHFDKPADVTQDLEQARRILEEVAAVIEGFEQSLYRYPLAHEIGGGVTPETALPNGTTYPYRVFTKTHLLSYWKNRQQQVEDLVAGVTGDPDAVRMTPVFAAPDTDVTIAWPALEGLSGAVDMGDGHTLATSATTWQYAAAGIYRIEGALDTSGSPLAVGGWLVRSDVRATMAAGGFTLTSPDSDLARSVLRSLIPSLRFAVAGDTFALLAEPGGRDTGAFDEVIVGGATMTDQLMAGPLDFALPLPDPASGLVAARVGVSAAHFAPASDSSGDLTMSGELSVPDLVDALVALAGFEPVGALSTLAGVLGFDPEDPPETLPFAATLAITRD